MKLIEEFCTDLMLRELSEDTQKTYPTYIKSLYDFNNGDLIGITEDVLSSYLAHLRGSGIRQTSINRYFSAINTFYKFLMFKRYISTNPVIPVKEHYLRTYKTHDTKQRRQCLTIEQASKLVNSIFDTRDKAVVVLLFKTGIRRKELSELNVKDVDISNKTIRLKPTAKRSNEIVYFDDETAYVLNRWFKRRDIINQKGNPALFLDRFGKRLEPYSINKLFEKCAIAAGFHDRSSDKLQDRLSPHSARHFFSTRLREAGCPREYVQELRGDTGHDAFDIYYHIDKKKLQQAYEDCVPKLGIL